MLSSVRAVVGSGGVAKRPFQTSATLFRKQRVKSKSGAASKWQKFPLPRRLDLKISSDPRYEDPSHFENFAATLRIGPQYIDQLKKLWHEKWSTDRDVFYKRDDRLTRHDSRHWLPEIDPMTPKVGYDKVEALKDAPESVKKIFSVGFGKRKDYTDLWKQQIKESVTTAIDNSSIEAKIASSTARIRSWAKLVDEIALQTHKKPKWLIKLMHYQISYRRKCLRLLRSQNYDSFERILNELKIAYYIPLRPEDKPSADKDQWVLEQIREKVEAEKDGKLEKYYKKLLEERADFDKMKAEKLAALEDEEALLKKQLHGLTGESGELLEVAGKYQGHTIDSASEMYEHRYYYSNEWYPDEI